MRGRTTESRSTRVVVAQHGIGRFAAAFALATSLLVGAAPASAAPLLDFTGGGEFFSAFDATLGWRFTTTAPISIDGVGLWDEGGNGLVNDHLVGLWTATGSLLFSAAVTNGGTSIPSSSPDGRWIFASISPMVLAAGDYVLGASYLGGLVAPTDDPIREAATIDLTPGVTFVEARSSGPGGFSFPNMPQAGVGGGYFGPNLRTVEPVPEPSTLTLFAIGALGLLAASSRKRRRSHTAAVALSGSFQRGG